MAPILGMAFQSISTAMRLIVMVATAPIVVAVAIQLAHAVLAQHVQQRLKQIVLLQAVPTKAITRHVRVIHAVAVAIAKQVGLKIAKAPASQTMCTKHGRAMGTVTMAPTSQQTTVVMSAQQAFRFI